MKKWLLLIIIFLAAVLRLYKLDQVPPSLYWDEASLGYNAYSISQTLRDEHGNFLPISSFPAFGDYKPIGYIYAAVPFIKLFGLSEVAVRSPSALAGILLVLVTYFLVKELLDNRITALLASLFVAVSPWAIQMSRGAFEANLATFFSATGIYLFLKKKRIFSALCFVAAMYTFNSHRVFVPLIIFSLGLIYLKDFKKHLIFYFLTFILVLPLIPHLISSEGHLRFNEVTWLNDLNIVETANKNIALNNNALWAKVIFNRRIYYTGEFLKHYFDHYRFDFLFQTGDVNPRLSSRTVGEMYLIDLPLVLLGLFVLIKKRDKTTALIFSWLLLAPIPAAFARETPHALRILNILPVPMIIGAVGLVKLPKIFKLLVPLILSFLIFFYLKNYYFIYPVKFAADWQSGYKQMVQSVAEIQEQYDYVSVTNSLGRPYIYFLFYNQYAPQKYWVNRDASRDKFGFWTVASFDKYVFSDNISKKGRWLYVRSVTDQITGKHLVKTVSDFSGRPVFFLYD